MFTGIISDVGVVRALEQASGMTVVIGCRYAMDGVAVGASIACAGVCLTVTHKGADWFGVDVSSETLDRSTLGQWAVGMPVNLERALKLGDELGGHIVTGHVDGVGRLISTVSDGASCRWIIAAPRTLAPFLATKGSVAVDGVSLTVNSVEDDPEEVRFGVTIIPHTQAATTFGALAPGALVNLEIDPLARYVARLKEALA